MVLSQDVEGQCSVVYRTGLMECEFVSELVEMIV